MAMQDNDPVSPKELKRWREEKMQWTQARAAAWFKVHLRTYQGWEEGRRKKHGGHMIRKLMQQARVRKPSEGNSTDLFD